MKKLNNISLLRLIACIGVFLFHYLAGFTSFNTNVYMPSYYFVFIFSFVSAFLYSQKDIEDPKGWLKKNIIKLIVPLLVYVLIASILLIIVGLIRYQGDIIATFQGFAGENPSTHSINFVFGNLWFLLMLVIAYLFTPILYKISRNKFTKKLYRNIWIIIIVLVAIIESCFNFFAPIFTIYCLSYVLGRFLYNKTLNEKCVLLPIISFVILVGGALLWYLVVGKIPYGYFSTHIRLLRVVTEVMVSIPFSLLFLYILRGLNKYNIFILKYTDKYSFPFYMCQQLFMVGTLMFYELIPNWYFVPVIGLTIVLAIIVQFISDLILKKINFVKG